MKIFNFPSILLICLIIKFSNGRDWSEDQFAEKWNTQAKKTIDSILNNKANRNIAKNLIMFIGDGMGVSTITAGRIRKGQRMGLNGEELVTNMESLPHSALSKTYNIDAQTADSAGTATAYLCGIKTRAGVIGHNGFTKVNNCPSSVNNKVDSILKWAHKAGKSVGIVTTTRITHASPAGAYANVAFREWEGFDGDKFTKKEFNQGCRDIADQLITENNFINIIFGGGRMKFLPNTTRDPFSENSKGLRIDNRNLIDEWTQIMIKDNKKFKYIWNASEFRKTDFRNLDHVLGLFSYSHLKFEHSRNPANEPSLTEMTEKAIELLSKNKNGYFLFVEGGRIDHGHHESKAVKALDEFVSFDESIGKALDLTSTKDTMIVVSADHSHTFSMGGNSLRGNPILGIALNSYSNVSDANVTFTSLTYGNGPGGILRLRRFNLTNNETEGKEYTQEAAVYKKFETHGGEDVAIFASGPLSFLFSKTVEQNYIAHAMAYSACIGPYNNQECLDNRGGEKTDNVFQSFNNLEQFDSTFQVNPRSNVDSFAIKQSFQHKLMFFLLLSLYRLINFSNVY